MSMTKKHYEGIADALVKSQASNAVIDAVAAFCKEDNPKFDVARFRSVAVIDAASPEGKRRAELRKLARLPNLDNIEIDDDAAISEVDDGDNGAYVSAWLWVDFSDTKFDKEAAQEAA